MKLATFLTLFVFVSAMALPSRAQDAGRQARMAAVQAVEAMLMDPGASFDVFVDEKLSVSYRKSMSSEQMRDHLQSIRDAVAGAGGLDLRRAGDDIHMVFSDGADAIVVVRVDDAGAIDALELQEKKAPGDMTRDELLDEARRLRIRGLESLGSRGGDEDIEAFAGEHLSDGYRASTGEAEMMSQLKDLRSVIAAAGGIMAEIVPEGTRLSFRGPKNVDILFALEEDAPYRIAWMEVSYDVDVSDEMNGVEIAPIAWENVETRLREEEEAGFAGTVLLARDGDIVLHQGYGEADRNTGRKNTVETVYDIGSVPIDFTRAAILKLQDDGALQLSDAIGRFIDDVPADKRSMTLEHLMTGASGLPNFHHLMGDENKDLSWIDRYEAVRRMMAQPMLFEPGTDESHSHSAYTLLAAIVEIVSKQSYGDFLQATFFDPIGMTRTGFYGDEGRFADDEMAIGYGFEQASAINNPRYWGPTSWLSMGAGGMVSTPGDMYKWLQAMYSGEYLSEKATAVYRHGGVLAGGSDRGFLMMFVDNPETTVIVSSNAHAGPGDMPMAVARALIGMVRY